MLESTPAMPYGGSIHDILKVGTMPLSLAVLLLGSMEGTEP
jgi:hypothetical protein